MRKPQTNQRIYKEELYRFNVRQELEKSHKPKEGKNKFLEFFNSTFGLWLLSSVAVGIITWGYTQWTENRKTDTVKAELIRKLNTEISSRVIYFDNSLINVRNKGDLKESLASLFIQDSPGFKASIVYPEFEKRNLRSLLWELRQSIPESEVGELVNSIQVIEDIRRYPLELERYVSDLEPLTPDREQFRREVQEQLRKNFSLARFGIRFCNLDITSPDACPAARPDSITVPSTSETPGFETTITPNENAAPNSKITVKRTP